jgi:two-component system, NarL family, response regulator NreC
MAAGIKPTGDPLRAGRVGARRGACLSGETIRVTLVDDHTLVREGLRAVLQSASDMMVVGEAENAEAAVALAHHSCPDVLVLALEKSDGAATHALCELVRALPEVRVLVLMMYAEQERVLALLEAGARGYLSKSVGARDLLEAIRTVAVGEVYVCQAAGRLLAADVAHHREMPTPQRRFQTLSGREQSIVQLLAAGFTGVEIARRLGISGKTVDAYKRRVQEKLGLEHRTDYVRFALEAGVLTSGIDRRAEIAPGHVGRVAPPSRDDHHPLPIPREGIGRRRPPLPGPL